MSITPASNVPVSVDYTNRDYYSLREALIARIQNRIPDWTASDPADFGVALVEAFSYMGDIISYYIDRTANESFLETAIQRESLIDIAQSYGYIPAGYRQAYVDLTFTNTSSTTVTLSEGTVISADITLGDTVQTIYFSTQADVIVSASGQEVVGAVEGRSIQRVSTNTNSFGELLGTSSGLPEQIFELSQTSVVDGSVQVYVQDGSSYSKWTQVQHIMDYDPTDLVFTVSTDENNVVTVNFGDGISGAIPTLLSEIRVEYTVGSGSLGNVPASTLTTIEYIPGLSESQTTAIQSVISVDNLEAAIGGADPETNDQIRVSAPASLRSGNRAVTLKDFSDLALSVSGVGKANAYASVWTSISLYIAPSRSAVDTDDAPGLDGTGTPTEEYTRLKGDVETFLEDKLLIGTTVTVQPPDYIDAILNLEYVRLPQYTAVEVEAGLKSALLSGFNYVNLSFQDTIYPQDIEFVLIQTPGVKTVKVTALYRDGDLSDLTTLVGQADEIFRFSEANLTLTEI
jgi:Baseplate J-like protein